MEESESIRDERYGFIKLFWVRILIILILVGCVLYFSNNQTVIKNLSNMITSHYPKREYKVNKKDIDPREMKLTERAQLNDVMTESHMRPLTEGETYHKDLDTGETTITTEPDIVNEIISGEKEKQNQILEIEDNNME